ncbi:MAG: prepilin-type N-terminal cleavage/methylation domain-containing protein [Eubacterium sp.]|nr:prepilin-type N-terminal cleavage/methylation domain-containing protein [Eubacterium sp.]
MKDYNNKGFTLVELVVAFAILALIATGIVGIMSSNSVLFRKTKKDINISTSAQESYNKITEDLMQAKYVYIEGYTANTDISFPKTEPGSTTATLTGVQILRASDINLINDSSAVGTLSTFMSTMSTSPDAARTAVGDDDSFDSYYQTFRYMSATEKEEYERFLTSIPTGTYSPFTSASFKEENITTGDITYHNVYVSKIIIMYAVPLKPEYVPSSLEASAKELIDLSNPGAGTRWKDNDFCIETIEFVNDKMYISDKYHYMTDINSSGSITADNNIYASDINYVTTGSSNVIPGVVAKIDGENDSIMLDVYFAKYDMSYQNKGMTVIRNSYVLHDAK